MQSQAKSKNFNNFFILNFFKIFQAITAAVPFDTAAGMRYADTYIIKEDSRMKKILLAVLALIVLIFGGITVFVNTKSDFIIEKVSEVLEKNLQAKLEMQSLPEISIFPSLSVSAGKSSVTAPDYTVNFDKASVDISLMQLFSGNVQINSVQFENLNLTYTAPAQNKTAQKKQNSKAAPAQSKSLEEIFAFVPAEISVKNSNIHYKDQTQEVHLQNINALIEDFGINKNSSVNLSGGIAYKTAKQDLAFNLAADIDFLFMGNSLDYSVKTFNFTPVKGFPFTHPIDVTAESSMNFSPLIIEKLNGKIKSPFADLDLKGNGDDKKGDLTVTGEIYPKAIQENFLSGMKFRNIPEKLPLQAKLSNTADTVTVHEIRLQPNGGTVVLSGLYNMPKQNLEAKITAENLAVQDYLPVSENRGKAEQTKKTEQKTKTAQFKSDAKQDSFNLTFKVTADAKNISYEKLVFSSVKSVIDGKFGAKEKTVRIKPLTAVSGGDTVTADADISLAPKDLIRVNVKAPELHTKHWFTALLGNVPADGILSLDSALSFQSADPLNTLNGQGSLNGKNLRIETRLLPFIANLLQLKITLQDFYEFTVLKVPFTAKNGLITTNALVDSSAVSVTANGTAHPGKDSVNMAGNAELKKQGLIFPYKVTGSLSNPKIGLDLGKQLQVLGSGLLHTGQSIGGGVVDGGKTIGGGVVEGGKAIGGGLLKGGKALEEGLGKLFK